MDSPRSISEAAAETGLTEDTLRYYERMGILAGVDRTPAGHRRYSKPQLDWLRLATRLRNSGMSIETLQRYGELSRLGSGTIPQRRAILEEHRVRIAAEAQHLLELDAMLRQKLAHYDDAVRLGLPDGAPCEGIPRPAQTLAEQSSHAP